MTMGKKSEMEGLARRDVVLMLLRRVEVAAVFARRHGVPRGIDGIVAGAGVDV
jgi:hypothetical protein